MITLTDRQIPLVHLILKAKLLVQLTVTLSIKTIKIYRPRARSELAINWIRVFKIIRVISEQNFQFEAPRMAAYLQQ